MNDFTIEELEELYFFTCVHKKRYKLKYPQELLDKLQSMIDSYCDHDSSDIPRMALIKICKNCNKYLEHQLWENMI